MTMTDYATLPVDQVQMFLDNIGAAPFTVIFLKKDGTQRLLTGNLDVKAKRSSAVPVQEAETGQWRSFRVDSVLSLQAAT